MIELDRANSQIRSLYKRLEINEAKGERLQGIEKDYNRLRRFLGGDRTDEIIGEVKVQEIADKAKGERKSEVFGRGSEGTAIWTITGKRDYER